MAITIVSIGNVTSADDGSPVEPSAVDYAIVTTAACAAGDTIWIVLNVLPLFASVTVTDSAGNVYDWAQSARNCLALGLGGTITVRVQWPAQYTNGSVPRVLACEAYRITGLGAAPNFYSDGGWGTPGVLTVSKSVNLPSVEAREALFMGIARWFVSELRGDDTGTTSLSGTTAASASDALADLTNFRRSTVGLSLDVPGGFGLGLSDLSAEVALATEYEVSATGTPTAPGTANYTISGFTAGGGGWAFGLSVQAVAWQSSTPPGGPIATVRDPGGRRIVAFGDSGSVVIYRYDSGGTLLETVESTAKVSAGAAILSLQLMIDPAGRLWLIYIDDVLLEALLYLSKDNGRTWTNVATIATGYESNDGRYDDRTGMMVVPLWLSSANRWDYVVGTLDSGGTTFSWSSPRTLVGSATQYGRLLREADGVWSFVYTDTGSAVKIVRCRSLTPSAGTFA